MKDGVINSVEGFNAPLPRAGGGEAGKQCPPTPPTDPPHPHAPDVEERVVIAEEQRVPLLTAAATAATAAPLLTAAAANAAPSPSAAANAATGAATTAGAGE